MAEKAENNKPAEEKPLSKREQKAAKKAEKKAKIRAKRAERARIVKLFPANKKGYHIMPFLNFLRFLFYPVHTILRPFKFHGPWKVGKGAYIYVGNHYSMFDIFFPAHTTREGIHFLAKQSVMEAPVMSYWTYKIGAIGVMRDGSDVRTLMESIKVLRNGEKISLFPEGTRNRVSDEEFLPFRGGAALMSIKTKTPIIPFVICNRPRLFRITHVVFGEPMELTEYYDRKLSAEDYEEAENKLKNRLYELRAEHREWLANKKKKKK